MTKIICFANHKGGVGKTTSVANIAAALNLLGKKVLVCDLDPQENLSLGLGITNAENNIYGALMNNYVVEPIEIMKDFFLIPSTIHLSGAELELDVKFRIGREYRLKKILDSVKDAYDFVLIDCPPSLGLLTLNALVASDEVIIPLQSEFYATKGLTKLVEVVQMIRDENINPNLYISGIFLTQYDNRKILNKDVFSIIERLYEKEVFNTKIRNNISLAEAPAQKLDIFRYNAKSTGAEDYKALTEEIIKRYT